MNKLAVIVTVFVFFFIFAASSVLAGGDATTDATKLSDIPEVKKNFGKWEGVRTHKSYNDDRTFRVIISGEGDKILIKEFFIGGGKGGSPPFTPVAENNREGGVVIEANGQVFVTYTAKYNGVTWKFCVDPKNKDRLVVGTDSANFDVYEFRRILRKK